MNNREKLAGIVVLAIMTALIVWDSTQDIVQTITIFIAILAVFGGRDKLIEYLTPKPELVAELLSIETLDSGMDEPRTYFKLKIENVGSTIASSLVLKHVLLENKKILITGTHDLLFKKGDIFPQDCEKNFEFSSPFYENQTKLIILITCPQGTWNYEFEPLSEYQGSH